MGVVKVRPGMAKALLKTAPAELRRRCREHFEIVRRGARALGDARDRGRLDDQPVMLERKATFARWTYIIGEDGTIVYKNTKVRPADDSALVLEFTKGRKGDDSPVV